MTGKPGRPRKTWPRRKKRIGNSETPSHPVMPNGNNNPPDAFPAWPVNRVDEPPTGFVPDQGASENASWNRLRAGLVAKSRLSVSFDASHLNGMAGEEEPAETETASIPPDFDPASIPVVPETTETDGQWPPSEPFHISWSSRYSIVPQVTYWTVHSYLPVLPPTPPPKAASEPTSLTPSPIRMLQSDPNQGTESTVARDRARAVSALEGVHIHLDPPEMSWFLMSDFQLDEISRLAGSPVGNGRREPAGAGGTAAVNAGWTAPVTRNQLGRLADMLQFQSEAAALRFLMPVVVPSLGGQSTSQSRSGSFVYPLLSDGIDINWDRFPALLGPEWKADVRPAYSVGFDRLAFPPDALRKLDRLERAHPTIGMCNVPRYRTDPPIFFPFFVAEASGWPWPDLARADVRSAHAMAHAGRAVFELFRLAGRQGELDAHPLGFSVQMAADPNPDTGRGECLVTVCAHYPILSGPNPDWCRVRLKDFGRRPAETGKRVGDVHRFVLNLYSDWAIQHLARILRCLDDLEVDLDGTVIDPVSRTQSAAARVGGNHAEGRDPNKRGDSKRTDWNRTRG